MADTTATVPGGDGPAPPKDAYACKSEHYFAVVDSLMPEDTERAAARIALAAIDRHRHLKDAAQFVKVELDRQQQAMGSGRAADGVFHCVVGKSFATAVSHESRQFAHFKIDTHHVIVWKSKDSPLQAAA